MSLPTEYLHALGTLVNTLIDENPTASSRELDDMFRDRHNSLANEKWDERIDDDTLWLEHQIKCALAKRVKSATPVGSDFKDLAFPMIARNIPVIRLKHKSKEPMDSGWQSLATTNSGLIEKWNKQTPSINCGCVAKPRGVLFFEIDQPGVVERYEQDTGEKFPETFTVESGKQGFHYYFAQTDRTREVGNISQKVLPFGSVRQNNQFVVSAGSVHPETGRTYTVHKNVDIVPMPDALINWINNQRTSAASTSKLEKNSAPIPTEPSGLRITIDPELIISNARDNTMASIAGSLRKHNCNRDEIYDTLIELVDNHMVQPEGDRKTDKDAKRIADSYSRDSYAPTQEPPTVTVLIGGKPIIPGEGTTLVGLRITKDAGVEEVRKRIETTKQAEQPALVNPENFRDYFRSLDELEDGDVRMLIDGFLPEGVNLIGGLAGQGKTLFALSLVKSLTSGQRFLDKFQPDEIIPVIYMIPESSARAFKARCRKFGITNDGELFLVRTITEGAPLMLDSPILAEAVKRLKPLIVLDTLPRFNEAQDENDAAANKKLVDDIAKLRALGCVGVLALHHATKSSADLPMTLENILRGTGDIGALADSCYGVRRDRVLYADGAGPMELEVRCLKPRDFDPPAPFRIAASYQSQDGSVKSYIDDDGDFHIVEAAAVREAQERAFIKAITEDPAISRNDLATDLGSTSSKIRALAKRLGYERSGGRYGTWFSKTMKPTPIDSKTPQAA